MPIMEYPRNSNLPIDLGVPHDASTNYFAKMPPIQMQSQMQSQMQPQMQLPSVYGGGPQMQSGGYHFQPPVQMTSPPSSGDYDQIQRQLQDLQRTVQQQDKLIRGLKNKKPVMRTKK